MDSFLNGYVATVLLDENEKSEKIRDLVQCCDSQSIDLDPRIERALCLRLLALRAKNSILDQETLILAREIGPPNEDGENWLLHLGLRTQVVVNFVSYGCGDGEQVLQTEEGLPVGKVYKASHSTDLAAGGGWKNSLSVRKRYVTHIIDRDENLSDSEIKQAIEHQFPRSTVLNLLEQLLEKEEKELLCVQQEAHKAMKQRKASSEVLRFLSPVVEEEESGCTYNGTYMSVEEIARRVVYEGENIRIPKLLPPRFHATAEMARRRIEELREQKKGEDSAKMDEEQRANMVLARINQVESRQQEREERIEKLTARVEELTKQLESYTTPCNTPSGAVDSERPCRSSVWNPQGRREVDKVRTPRNGLSSSGRCAPSTVPRRNTISRDTPAETPWKIKMKRPAGQSGTNSNLPRNDHNHEQPKRHRNSSQ